MINRDLQNLTEVKKEPPVEADDDDLPPLLQVNALLVVVWLHIYLFIYTLFTYA